MPRVTIYSNDNCIYCQMAKRLLDKSGVAYSEVDLAMDDAGRRALVELTGRMTFPQILIDGDPIGGYAELLQLARKHGLPRDDVRRAA